jgi:two-component system, LytTR family, sensor kinase
MRRITNFQWILILAMGALVVFLVGAASLYIEFKLPDLLPKDVNDAAGAWAFGAFWVIHAPIIFILSRRFSFQRRRLTKSLLIYFSVGIVWAMLIQGLPQLLVPFLIDSVTYTSESFRHLFRNWFGNNFLPNMLVCWLILSIGLISSYYERYQKEMLKASQLDAQLSNARLQALKMQLHPHFLFNTLHSISALVLKNENRDAVKMINRLSELLRLTLDNIETQVVTLQDEIEFTRRYLEIERFRFKDRLEVEWEIDSQALTAEVPNLILQPLVENAMRHGVDSNSGNSRIQIAVRLQNNQVLMEVRDDGKNPEKISWQNGADGLGLKNTRERLSELYGEDYSFSLSRRGSDWTVAQIVIPFSLAKAQTKGELH